MNDSSLAEDSGRDGSGEDGCNAGGDACAKTENVSFTSIDRMRFTSLTYELIEELRLRRELDEENEKKIQRLLEDRFAVGWKLDKQKIQLSSIEEKHEANVRETKHTMDEKMRELQIEASQHQVYRKLAEKEREALKEDIKKLQLANFSLEKKVRESEHHEKIQASEREQHIRQITKFESQHSQLDGMMKKLTDTQSRLEQDMVQVKELNKKLLYQNNQQKVVLQMKCEQISKLKEDLLAANIKNKLDPSTAETERKQLQGEITCLKSIVKQGEEENKKLCEEKDDWKEKYWGSLRQLDEAHRLTNAHLANVSSYMDQCQAAEEERDQIRDLLEISDKALKDTQDLLQEQLGKYENSEASWTIEKEYLTSEVSCKADQLLEVLATVMEGEETIAAKTEEIQQLQKQLHDAMLILNVSRSEVETQSNLCMLEMTDSGLQVQPEAVNVAIECCVEIKSRTTQTIDPALCSIQVQTETVECLDKQSGETTLMCATETQTAWCSKDRESQTDPLPEVQPDNSKLSTLDTTESTTNNQTDLLLQVHQDSSNNNTSKLSTLDITVSTNYSQAKQSPVLQASHQDENRDKKTNNDVHDLMLGHGETNNIQHQTQNQLGPEDVLNTKKEEMDIKGNGSSAVKINITENSETAMETNCRENQQGNLDQCFGKSSETAMETNRSKRQKGDPGQCFGIPTPSLDLQRISAVSVLVDPEEFGVELTQDGTSDQANRETQHEEEDSEDEIILIEESADELENDGNERNKFVLEDGKDIGTHSREKADKRKLSTKVVLEQFTHFDQAREKFKGLVRTMDECTHSKIMKLDDNLKHPGDELTKVQEKVNPRMEQSKEDTDGTSNETGNPMTTETQRKNNATEASVSSNEPINVNYRKNVTVELTEYPVTSESKNLAGISGSGQTTASSVTRNETICREITKPQFPRDMDFIKSAPGRCAVPMTIIGGKSAQTCPNLSNSEIAFKTEQTVTMATEKTNSLAPMATNAGTIIKAPVMSASSLGSGKAQQGKAAGKTSGRELLQRYQDIVAMLKPGPSTTVQRPDMTGRSTVQRHGRRDKQRQSAVAETPERENTAQDASVLTGTISREATQSGILRGTSESRRSKTVSWNEQVQLQEFNQ